ncbi:MAG: NAD(P)-dependent oxidoreductase [Nibricoccus sp.]
MSSFTHRIVLTGASGTLGSNFSRLAAERSDMHILALLREQSRPPVPGPHMDCVRVQFEDKAAVQKIIQDYAPTCLVHCAATGMDFPKPVWFDLIRFNVDATINLCESVSRLKGCRFIFISTGLVYGRQNRPLTEDDPLDTLHPYGASKAAADMLVRAAATEFGVPLTILRPFSFTGPGDDGNRLFPLSSAPPPPEKPSGFRPATSCETTARRVTSPPESSRQFCRRRLRTGRAFSISAAAAPRRCVKSSAA